MNDEDFFKWRNSSEGQKWIENHAMNPEATPRKDMRKRLQDKQEEGKLKEDHAHHAGRRDHDAEAHMFDELLKDTNRETIGEFHFKPSIPACPACKDMIFRFAKERPKIKVIQH